MTLESHAPIRRLTEILVRGEWQGLSEVFAPDAVMEFPQSGEVFEGIHNITGQFADYPTMPQDHVSALEVTGEQPAYALSPAYTLIAVTGGADRQAATFRARYPDGSNWWVILHCDSDAGRITRSKLYFAPEFEPPDWRAKYRVAVGTEGASG